MRNIIKRSVALAGFLAAISSVAFANPSRVELKVPFAFTVAGQTLPAGSYSIERPRDMEDTAVLIQSTDGQRAAVYALISQADQTQDENNVVFAKAGDSYRLAQIGGWTVAE